MKFIRVIKKIAVNYSRSFSSTVLFIYSYLFIYEKYLYNTLKAKKIKRRNEETGRREEKETGKGEKNYLIN